MSRLPLIAMVGALLACPVLAEDSPTQTKVLEYRIHTSPTDPKTPVAVRIQATIQAEQLAKKPLASGQTVGWRVVNLKIIEPVGKRADGIIGKAVRYDRVWSVKELELPTKDGLWWIAHEDATAPKLAEFAELPKMEGIATQIRGRKGSITKPDLGSSLKFKIEGAKYTPATPSDQPPFDPTFSMSYKFEVQQAGGDFATWKEAVDDPVEPVEPDEPPFPGPDEPVKLVPSRIRAR